MKVFLYRAGDRLGRLNPGAVDATSKLDCPGCGAANVTVFGNGVSVGGRDYYRADAKARCCGKTVGEIRAYVDTIFGVEEDSRVGQRARVY